MRRSSLLTLTLLALVFCAFTIQPLFAGLEYIQNTTIKLGINTDWGGGIGYFSRVYNPKNVLNRADTGRNIQQSFYGDLNGLTYNGIPWRYNPVQGGDQYGNASIIQNKINWGDAIYVKTNPKDWAANNVSTNDVMEQWITLRGGIAQIVYRYEYTGSGESSAQHQEMPAPYFVSDLETLAFYSGGFQYRYKNDIPINNGNGTNNDLTTGQDWAAFVNTAPGQWGCGVLTPNTPYIEYFRSTGTGGDTGTATSYFAPMRTETLVNGFDVQYTAYLDIGNLTDIKDHFVAIRSNGFDLAYNGGLESGGSSPDNWTSATDRGGSHTYQKTGGSNVYSGSRSVGLTAQSAGVLWELPYYKQTQKGVTDDTWYRITFRGKALSLYNGDAGIRIIQFHKNGNVVSDSGLKAGSKFSGNNSSFQYRNITFKTLANVNKIEIRLQLNSLDSWAQAWFDNITFTLMNP